MMNDLVIYNEKVLGSFKTDATHGRAVFVAESPKDLTAFFNIHPAEKVSIKSYEEVVTEITFGELMKKRLDKVSAIYLSLDKYIGRNLKDEELKRVGLD